MLVQFEVNNFASIKDTVTFGLNAGKKDTHSFPVRKYNLLQSVVLYGANASGKSNLLKAMNMMASLVLNKNKVSSSVDSLEHQPFLLNSETETASTSFEMIFIIDEIIYRYGFEYDSKTVYAEWLFADEKGTEAKLFYRDVDDGFYVNPTKFKEGKGLEDRTLENHLFLWKCDSENGTISKKIIKWFFQLNMIDGLDTNNYLIKAAYKLNDIVFKKNILELIKIADLGIANIDTQDEDLRVSSDFLSLPNVVQRALLGDGFLDNKKETITMHQKFDKNNNLIGDVEFSLKKHESLGTKKFFAISAPILDTLENGKVLIIDELDASLHPLLTMHLIKMFHNKELNKKNAQLIFATHDTNLLQDDLLCRDQVWFAEKDKYGATDIYSLLEYKAKTRKDSNKEKLYLQGRYGAIPYIGEFHFEDLENES
ncbi:MAG TPA: ATP-binding protein [Flavobacteriaceae bacterium]|nr:ATP-binding protein [Flavobacteriaceae bacterium]